MSQVFFVRPDGDDRRDGKSKKNAFRTVARAIRACHGLAPTPIVEVAAGSTWPKRQSDYRTATRGHK